MSMHTMLRTLASDDFMHLYDRRHAPYFVLERSPLMAFHMHRSLLYVVAAWSKMDY